MPGIPDRGDRPPTPLGDGWGPWRGPVFQRLFTPDPDPPLTVSDSLIEVEIPWDPDADDWATAGGTTTVDFQVDWHRGDVRVAECLVAVAYRPTRSSTDDGAECRASLQSINNAVPSSRRLPITFDDRAYRQPPFAAVTADDPCRHTVSAGNVNCRVVVKLGSRPVAVTTVDHPIVNFTRTQPVQRWPWTSATERVTWTKGAATKRVDVWASKARSSATIQINYRDVDSSSLGSVSSSNYSRSSEFSQRTLTVDGVATTVYALFLGSVL